MGIVSTEEIGAVVADALVGSPVAQTAGISITNVTIQIFAIFVSILGRNIQISCCLMDVIICCSDVIFFILLPILFVVSSALTHYIDCKIEKKKNYYYFKMP